MVTAQVATASIEAQFLAPFLRQASNHQPVAFANVGLEAVAPKALITSALNPQ